MQIQAKDQVIFIKDELAVRFEAIGTYTRLYFKDKRAVILESSLSDIEEQLSDSGFLQVHPMHIVNINHVAKISMEDDGTIIMEDGSRIPTSGGLTTQLIHFLENHINP